VACAYALAMASQPAALRKISEGLVLKFFDAQITDSRRKDFVYFHHVSKSGGSFLCALSWLNGCRAPGGPEIKHPPGTPGELLELVTGGNCWSKAFGDKFTWFPESIKYRNQSEESYTCARRLDYSRESGLNFFANEGFLPEPPMDRPCSTYGLTLEVLREPISRAISHLNHEKDDAYLMDGPAKACVPAEWRHTVKVPFQFLNLTCYGTLQHVTANNYQTRLLAGRDAFQQPLGGVSEKHLAEAKNALRRFDVLLLVNHRLMENAVDADTILKVGLGFRVRSSEARKINKRKYEVNLTEADAAFLREQNSLDLELFNYAEDLFELDSYLYHQAEKLCERSNLVASKSEESFSTCKAFSEALVSEERHWKAVVETRRQKQSAFPCGCGWAGSLEHNDTVPTPVSLRTGLSQRQECPRTDLYG